MDHLVLLSSLSPALRWSKLFIQLSSNIQNFSHLEILSKLPLFVLSPVSTRLKVLKVAKQINRQCSRVAL